MFVNSYPVVIAGGFMEQTDTPWFSHPFLIAFGAVLPLTAIGGLATVAANVVAERRARRLARPRPRLVYLFMVLGWALGGGAVALLAWAAGAGPGEDWIATGLVWGTMISACATLMMIGRALTAGSARRPAWFPDLGRRPAGSSGTPADTAMTGGSAAVPDA